MSTEAGEVHQTCWSGFDDKILLLYARGMTTREIQSHLQEVYGAEVSPTLISSVTLLHWCPDGTRSQLSLAGLSAIRQQFFNLAVLVHRQPSQPTMDKAALVSLR